MGVRVLELLLLLLRTTTTTAVTFLIPSAGTFRRSGEGKLEYGSAKSMCDVTSLFNPETSA